MINLLYFDPVYFDAEWALHHLVRRMVGAVYTGVVATVRHFMRFLDFVIEPRGVKIEQIWTGYATNTTTTVAVNIGSVTNSYIVVAVVVDSTNNVTGITLNAAPMTMHIEGATTGKSAAIYGLKPASLGAQNVVVTVGASVAMRVVVYQLSGVHQTTPTLDGQTVTTPGATSLTNTAMTASLYGLVIDAGGFTGGTTSASSGQTATTVNSIQTAGSTVPASVSVATSWATTSSSAGRMCGVSLNPA